MQNEKMVKLYNPHTQECSVTYVDEPYTVAAGATVEVPEDVANYWVTYIHNFLVIGGQEVVVPVTTEESVEETVKPKAKK